MKRSGVLCAALAVVLVFSGAMLTRQMRDYQTGNAAYAEARQIADFPRPKTVQTVEKPPQSAPEPLSVRSEAESKEQFTPDLAALRTVNREIVGWIEIPDTDIDYPLVQGTDNEYYLTHTWNNVRSAVGAIFMDSRCEAGGFNTILYGHRMNNGTMFASLKYYRRQAYWQAHPNVYLTDENGTHTYRIYAAYEVPADGTAYQLAFSGESDRQAFLRDGLARSVIAVDCTPSESSRILTLSTCTGRSGAVRWVVQAVEAS